MGVATTKMAFRSISTNYLNALAIRNEYYGDLVVKSNENYGPMC